MLNIIISRNGDVHGISIIPTKRSLNPYFLFGCECEAENVKDFKQHLDFAREHYPLSEHNALPEYTIRCLLMLNQSKKNDSRTISYPETGCINQVHSQIAFILLSMSRETNVTVYTTAECIVRALQVAVARKVAGVEEISISDQIGIAKGADIEFAI